jgi:hypothetical protein
MSKRATPTRSKKKPAIAPTSDTPPVDIPRPGLHREDRLPIYAVGSVKFEELCRDVLRHAHTQITRRTLKRTSGQRQYGVDVEGFTADHDVEVVVSCKCYRDVDPDHLLPWTQDFIKHLDGHWKGKGVKIFILAVTHPGNSDELTDAIHQCRDLLKPYGIKFEIWDTLEITDLLRKEPALVDRYFNRAWVEAISPQVVNSDGLSQGSHSATSGQSAAIVAMAQELAALASQRNALVGQRIEDANAEYRAGRCGRLVACLDELQSDAANWASLDPSIKARVLRAGAMLALNADEVPKSGELLDAADAIAPAPDRSTHAWYVRAVNGPQAAKDCLLSPQSARETEVLATLHIETGNASDAIALLDQAQPPVTPEQIRLRALAQCLIGEREAAVVTAAKASAGPMPSMAAVQSHAILHVMAALAPGADIQLGAVPNPFSSALVRVTPDATAHLDQAIDILSRQIPLVDAHLAGDLELWKLAALLIHPTRTRDGRQFAEELLNRTIVDPLVAAWCHSSGMRLRYGRIRKSFEDAIRSGTATPSHVIVLAMFEAERTSDSSAAQLIARHRAAFPEDDAFLSGWQRRFEGDPGSDPYAAAMHRAERRTYSPLTEFVSKQACSANQILGAASLLAMKRQWPLINSFRDKLLSLGTPRAIDLAARAAIETGAGADAIAIIDASAGVFPYGQIPEGLLYLRARAHDAQGNKGAALADMRTVAKASRDPAISNQLIHSLISIGKLKEARKHAKSYVKLPSIKPLELVQLAHVFKNLDANFSRALIKRAADDPKLPPHAVAGVMTLANTLGLAEVEGRMMRLIGEITKDGSAAGIFRYDKIEEVIAFMKERGEALEKEYNLWRAGMKPGHLVFDAKTFAGLYLSDPRDRLDAFYKPLPMLARAANAERRTIRDTNLGSRPDLVLDISALLLAMRCDLLPVVEKAYRIQIPPSVPFAVLAIEDDWPTFSYEFVQTARAWLSDVSTAVRTIEAVPADALPIGTDQHPFELIPDRVEAACRRAIGAGHLSQADAAQFLSADQVDAPAEPATAISALVVQPWALVRMAQAGILEPIAKTLPVYISTTACKEFVANIAMAERQTAMRRRISALQELVAERLSSNSWTMLAHQAAAKGDKRAKAVPHVRCLLEIMDTVNAGTATSIWAEDRTMSRTRLTGLLNIVDVADDLLKRGFIDANRHRAIDTKLRQLGYAFMPLPIAAIAADVERASVADGVLVESPELTQWRCWYAQEVERLAFANPAPEPDDTGRYTGEPRHLLNMMAAARDVLSEIWSNTKTTPEDKAARSNWVWTCLRFETSPALQWSTKSDMAQLTLMATVMFHTADLPLMSALNSDRLPVAARQPYMDWFVQYVLDARCVVDPVLGDSFARQLAALLVPQLDRDAEDEGDKDAQKYMKLMVARYLELFPENWRDRILSHCDLAEKLGTTSVMALDVGEVSIPASEIEGAIAGAANKVTPDDPVSVELSLADGKKATLTVRRETTGHLSAEIAAEEEKAHLDPFLVAVTLSDPAERLAALQAVPGPLDLPKEQQSATLREIASLPTLTERVVRQKAVFDREFVRRLDRVGDQLTHKQSIELSDLSLPAPETLAQYLRLNDLYRPQAGSLLEGVTAALVSDRGIETAVRRLGAVPFDLPDDFVKRIADVDVKLDQISSAAHARLYLKAWAKSGAPSEHRHQLLSVFLDRLEAQSKVMAALLWKGVRQLERSKTWKRLHQDIAYTLLWVWADRLASSITSTAVDTDKASEIIRRSEPVDLTHMFAADDQRPWYRHNTFDIAEGRVMAALIADVLPSIDCKTLPADLRDRLLSTVGTETNGVWYPRIDLAFPVAVEPATWTTKDVVAVIESSGAAKVMKPFGERDADRYVQALMAEPISPQNPFLVPGILAGADLSALSAETVPALTSYLEGLLRDYTSLADDPSYRHAQCVRAACLAVLNDAAEIDATLARMASAYRNKHGHQKSGYVIEFSRSPLDRDLAQLVEVVVSASRRRPGSATEKVTAMAATFETLPETWPGARLGLIDLLDRMIDMLEAKLVAALWPSLLRLRMAP